MSISIQAASVIVGVPVSRATTAACVCPACRTFEKEVDAPMCPRCTLKGGIRAGHSERRRQHLESVTRELLGLRLAKLDPDWTSKFLTMDQAARFYRVELDAMEPRS